MAYGTTGIFAALVLLAPALIYKIDDMLGLQLPEIFWIAVLIYVAVAGSLSLIVEQLYVAELYLWHLNWKSENEERVAMGKKPVSFNKATKPSFFDEHYMLQTNTE